MRTTWNKGRPKVPGSGSKLPIPERHAEIEVLYLTHRLSPREIAERLLPQRRDGRRAVMRILRRRGVPLRSPREAALAFVQTHGRIRRGPRYRRFPGAQVGQ